ncbi:hypothetical protein G7066_05100 [Leucobacter coleopterorum]|uniref:YdhG-like domain-containing protein n=1 Tax=Leucobacter coleopterorum TaxID=2714933 RepID=A0ABX6JV77_9MICO|nr:hypothetical protein [Leucobacter coleopterorum]QIM18190.1 hypothetical protein G7066_05100 [Leucobacter coleopterorum]
MNRSDAGEEGQLLAAMLPDIRAVFDGWPEWAADQLAEVRRIAYSVATEIPETGGLDEYLAWGQPSLRPRKPRVGTAIRLGVEHGERPAMLVHCATSLISEYKTVVGHLEFEGKRAVLFSRDEKLPDAEVRVMIELAFTSYLRRQR